MFNCITCMPFSVLENTHFAFESSRVCIETHWRNKMEKTTSNYGNVFLFVVDSWHFSQTMLTFFPLIIQTHHKTIGHNHFWRKCVFSTDSSINGYNQNVEITNIRIATELEINERQRLSGSLKTQYQIIKHFLYHTVDRRKCRTSK